jgi:uncharacterized membrane protein
MNIDTVSENRPMLRTIFMTGLLAVVGLFVLGIAFHLFGALLGVALWLFFLALKIAIIGGVVYLVIRIVSPDTARRLRQRFSGTDY